MRQFLAELWRRDRVLTSAGWFMLGLLAIMAAVAPFDSRTVTGINPWIKPAKFAFSITAYLWTVAWFMGYLPGPRWAMGTIRWGIPILMVLEILCIASQAARGVTSHFNASTAYDITIFAIMGFAIFMNVLLDLTLLGLFFQRGLSLAPGYLWAIRLGIVIFIIGGLEGNVMIGQSAHTVGAPDGGAGLPFLDWSTVAGDLRIAHLMGIHALQIIPLYGAFISSRLTHSPASMQVALVVTFALVYTALAFRMFVMAMQGQPLINM